MFKYVWIIMLAVGYVAGWSHASYDLKKAYKKYKGSVYEETESFIHYLWNEYSGLSDFTLAWIALNIMVAFFVSLVIFITSRLGV